MLLYALHDLNFDRNDGSYLNATNAVANYSGKSFENSIYYSRNIEISDMHNKADL